MHAREEAAQAGERHYNGSSCKKCGNTLRHTASAACVRCANESSRIASKKRRDYIKNLLSQPGKGVNHVD